MTPARLDECCKLLGWSSVTLARLAGVPPTTARRWLNGQRDIPANVDQVVERLVVFVSDLRWNGLRPTAERSELAALAGKTRTLITEIADTLHAITGAAQ